MSISQSSVIPENQLLGALRASEYQRLLPHLELVSLPLRKVLYEADEPIEYVYFLNRAIASLVSTMKDGSTVEIGLVGNERMVGLPVILGGKTTNNQAFVPSRRLNHVRI